ncbi:MAG: hypothetical protein NTX79_04450 [Candidatus Micrarchaeota archaeon]|nr:hypothetical protein [Candidatus Micrarchaeota archaeon]
MPTHSAVYDEVNRKWKSTCRVLLGGEVGELEEFREWLRDCTGPRRVEKSIKSGKPVVSYDGRYSKAARWISLDEVSFSEKPPALGINSLKDIDSILQAVSEQVVYTGNIHLGNSTQVENSTTVMDSHYIYDSESVWTSKYVAYTTHVIGECVFGGHCVSNDFLIRCNTIMCERCLEASKCELSSGIYFSHGLAACHDCMFSFNLRAKRNMIGNFQLTREKYAALRQKLVGEMRELLKKDKRLPHIFDMFGSGKPDYSPMKAVFSKMPAPTQRKTNKAVIENAFSETSKIIFGKPCRGIDKHSGWLKRNTRIFEDGVSCASGKPLLRPQYSDFLLFPKDRLLDLEEAEFISERLSLSEGEVSGLSVANAPRALSRIGYFTCEWKSGNNSNNIDCPIELDCIDSYRSIINIRCKRCAYGWWPRESEHMFGFNRTRFSSFCINAFDSNKIQRCFEVSEARNCSDCLYCHNVENVHDSMFCFNAKNLKCAVGNVELPREKYLEIKKRVLAELNEELARTDSISLSIFNLPDRIKSGR